MLNVDDRQESREDQAKGEPQSLVRTRKLVTLRPDEGSNIDSSVVSARFYNCFNYSLLPKAQLEMGYSIGITSALQGEGKTLVAANMALSLAAMHERKIVLVDLNLYRPRLHSVFGIPSSPGVVEAMIEPEVQVAPTIVKYLHLLTAGNPGRMGIGRDRKKGDGDYSSKLSSVAKLASLSILMNFRDVLYSLQQEFDIIVVDLPPVLNSGLPPSLAQQLSGLLLVLDATMTRREDLTKVLQRVGAGRILGLVLNRVRE